MSSADSIRNQLELARRELLDLTARNRLIHTPRGEGRSSRVEIVGQSAAAIYDRLVANKASLTFAAAIEKDAESSASSDADDASSASDEAFEAAIEPIDAADGDLPDEEPPKNLLLQTEFSTDRLQDRLLKMYYDARTFEEEQGVNILYLAAGFLQWKEADNGKIRQAPLILIPVTLDRKSAGARFRLRWSEDDIAVNLSLQAKLKAELGLRIPDIEDDADEFNPSDYFAAVTREIAGRDDWCVLENDVVLWFYSFSTFLMHRDLCDEAWPESSPLIAQQTLRWLLEEGFPQQPAWLHDGESIDDHVHPAEMVHVVDADSSQTLAIEEVRRGRNLVIQGPPGTGKSQTIANLIAAAVRDGKRVLFVAEKQAALEVVKRRLDGAGIGDVCLELHSHKSKKRSVLAELERTLQLGEPDSADIAHQAEETASVQQLLNLHAKLLHLPIAESGRSAFDVLSYICRRQVAGPIDRPLDLPAALTWSPADYARIEELFSEAAEFAAKIGDPSEHPWRGVGLDSILPMDLDRLATELPAVTSQLKQIHNQATCWQARLEDQEASVTLNRARDWLQLQRLLKSAPGTDGGVLFSPVWSDRFSDLQTIVEQGERLAEIEAELKTVIVSAAWKTDLSATRTQLAAYGRSWFGWFARDYWVACATLNGVLTPSAPRSVAGRLEILDDLAEGQQLRAALESDNAVALARSGFGDLWRGVETQWSEVRRLLDWRQQLDAVPIRGDLNSLFNALQSTEEAAAVDQFEDRLQSVEKMLNDLNHRLEMNWETTSHLTTATAQDENSELWRNVPAEILAEKWRRCGEDPAAIQYWFGWRRRLSALAEAGVADLAASVIAIIQNHPEQAAVVARRQLADSYNELLLRRLFAMQPFLAEFEGVAHEQTRNRFQACDEQRLQMSRLEIADAHFRGLPTKGSVGEVRVLRQEMRKRRRVMPLRKLLATAGRAVQATKPVFMMSPISVAQYLEPGAIEFDLLVIDEASQVRPVEALGAVARCRQIVVVGDDRQLPPTRFFDKVSDDVDVEEDFQPGDMESILDLCLARGIPQRTLCWHYRSQHESLIGVSNHEFYEGKLLVAPSPQRMAPTNRNADADSEITDADGELPPGLSIQYLPDGQFDRRRSACNLVEAAAVADAVMRHAEQHPELTIGVGAFSVAQRNAILEAIEERRRKNAAVESFFASDAAEPFFVKNLENIQGDERDVIFISIGYGPDHEGEIRMNFGPLNYAGGERRLNVLITRARRICRVFSSIKAEDIDLNRVASRGAEALKTFLQYAETREFTTAAKGDLPGDDFNEQIAEVVRELGYGAVVNVGAASFQMDVAVFDLEHPERYILGIECDGSNYRTANTARDRDRLRGLVLKQRGWRLHRIWIADWLKQPEAQLQQLAIAIENAMQNPPVEQQTTPAASKEGVARIETLPSDDVESADALNDDSPDYVEALIEANTEIAINDLAVVDLANIVRDVVQVESPVHRDEIGRRLCDAWGIRRRSRKIDAALDAAIEWAVDEGMVEQTELFISAPECATRVRSRRNAHASLRKPNHIPPAELQQAILTIASMAVSVSREELATEVARLLGVRAASRFQSIIADEIEELVLAGQLESHDERIQVSTEETEQTSMNLLLPPR